MTRQWTLPADEVASCVRSVFTKQQHHHHHHHLWLLRTSTWLLLLLSEHLYCALSLNKIPNALRALCQYVIIIIIIRHAPCQCVAPLATNSLHSDVSKCVIRGKQKTFKQTLKKIQGKRVDCQVFRKTVTYTLYFYIFRNYNHRPTFCSDKLVYFRWNFSGELINVVYFCKSDVSAVQGHSRSLMLVPIESEYVTSY